MLQMLQGLDFERYEPRLYLVSQGDIFSAEKAAEFESKGSFPSVRARIIPSIVTNIYRPSPL